MCFSAIYCVFLHSFTIRSQLKKKHIFNFYLSGHTNNLIFSSSATRKTKLEIFLRHAEGFSPLPSEGEQHHPHTHTHTYTYTY